MRKLKNGMLVFMLLFSITTLAASKPDAEYNENNTTVVVTKQNPEFTVKLKSNPTTGYAWFLREYSTKMITPVKHSFDVPKTKLIGAPGYELWTFRVNPDAFIVPQMLTIRMLYTRPWTTTDPGTQVIFRVMTRK